MKIAEISVKNSLLVNLISVFIVIAGAAAMFGMQREAFPQVNYDIVTVTTVWPGAPTEDMEKFVTIPLEEEIRSVSGLQEVESSSDEGLSSIGITIEPGVENKRKVVTDIQRAVDRVRNLPEEAEDPEVFELASNEFPVIELSIGGPFEEKVRRQYAESLKDELLDLSGVSQVREIAWRDNEFWVEVDPEKLKEYYVSMNEVMEALRTRNMTIPGGQLTTPDNEFNVRTTGEFRTAKEIEQVIIRANDIGNWLRVKDVARVFETFEDSSYIAKVSGYPASAMVVVKTEQSDAIKVVDRVRGVVKQFEKKMPEDMTIKAANDYSYYVKRRLNVLKNNGMIGFVLVLFILFLFLDPIPAFMTAIGIPIALCLSFIVMSLFGLTINLVSMLGIILVLGMLVDDGIIVAENVYRYVEEGMEAHAAAIKGTNEVALPVTITILTTFAAFGPLMFMEDIIGKFIREIPFVVMITLGSSLFEAFIILPSHLCDVLNFFKHKATHQKEKGWYRILLLYYTKFLKLCIHERYFLVNLLFLIFLFSIGLFLPEVPQNFLYKIGLALVVLNVLIALFMRRLPLGKFVILGFFCFSFFMGIQLDKRLKFLLFAGEGIEQFFIRAEAPKGTPLEKMNKLFEPVERIVAKLPEQEVESFRTYIGSIETERGFDPNAKRGTHLGYITIFLTPMQNRDRTPQEIGAAVREELKDIKGFDKLYTFFPKEGPPVGADIQVGFKGEEYAVMEEMAGPFMDYLKSRPGVSDVRTSYDFGKKQLRVYVDEERAKKYDLTIAQVASTVRNVFRGGVATTIKPQKAEEEIDVVVRFPKSLTDRLEVFEDILIPNSRGDLIKLQSVARIEEREGVYLINHHEGKRVLYVTATVNNKEATSREVNLELQEKFKDADDSYLGYTIFYGGEFEDQQKTFKNLVRSYLFAIFMIFILLVAMFRSLVQPFIIMIAIPFGIIGVILSFWVHDMILPAGRPLNFFALMGLVGLTGIVVNDSVILVDFVNRLRKEGRDRRMSLIGAGKRRLRPVIMTSITTIGGLVSVAYGFGGSDPFLKPMGLAIVWGLTFSTALTLIGIPCLYAVIDDLTQFFLHRSTVRTEPAVKS